jgi:hypothetical protein
LLAEIMLKKENHAAGDGKQYIGERIGALGRTCFLRLATFLTGQDFKKEITLWRARL